MATGSGREIPSSPVCTLYASLARLFASMAKCDKRFLYPSIRLMSSLFRTASQRDSCHPINSTGNWLSITILAASGSTQMLYSAAGVTFPSQQGAPPITTQRLTFPAIAGCFVSASARFVSGPSVTTTIPGFCWIVSINASAACLLEGVPRGGG